MTGMPVPFVLSASNVNAPASRNECRKTGPIHDVQDPGRQRRSEIAVQRRHRAVFDGALEPGAHDELVARPEFLDERADLAEIIGAVRVAHQDVLPPDERDRVDIGPAETALRRLQNPARRARRRLRRC